MTTTDSNLPHDMGRMVLARVKEQMNDILPKDLKGMYQMLKVV